MFFTKLTNLIRSYYSVITTYKLFSEDYYDLEANAYNNNDIEANTYNNNDIEANTYNNNTSLVHEKYATDDDVSQDILQVI